jgi:hypothetical protein
MTLALSGSAASLSSWVRATDAAFEAAGLALSAEARFAHAVLGSLTGHIDQVREYGDSAIEMAVDGGDRHLATFQCALLAIFLTVARDHDAAVRRAEQAHALASELGNPSLNAVAEMSLGFALSPIDPDAAIAHLRASLAMSNFATIEMVYDVGGRCLARLLAREGKFIAALKTYADCLDHAMDIGARIGITLACDSLTVDLVPAGRTELAATLFGALEVPMANYRGNPLIARDAARDALRHTMGEQRFEECAARGRAMDIEDLAVYTRAQIAQILADA